MQVHSTHHTVTPVTRRKRVASLVGINLPQTVELGNFSKLKGPWYPDIAAARANALTTLANIDFTKRDIVLWIPGTGDTDVHSDFRRAMKYVYHGQDVDLVGMKYDATWHMRESMPTGLATLKFVLEGIRQKLATMPPNERPRILMSGLSQGAWIGGEAIADPKLRSVVTRAAFMGHPWLAQHQYTDGRDPGVRVINHQLDQITMPINGDIGAGMDTMTHVRLGTLNKHLPQAVKVILANPLHGVLLLQNMLHTNPKYRPVTKDPHDYDGEMTRMIEFLRSGVLDKSKEELYQEQLARDKAAKAAQG